MGLDQRQASIDPARTQLLKEVALSVPKTTGDDRAAVAIGSLAMLAYDRGIDHEAHERDELVARVRRELAQGQEAC